MPPNRDLCLQREIVFSCIPQNLTPEQPVLSMSTQGTRWIVTTILGSGAFALYCGLDRFAPNITEMLVWREQQDRLEMLVGCA